MKEQYLGDGVYAHFDGYQIWLRVHRDGRNEQIALEPTVFDALLHFSKSFWAVKERFEGREL